MILKHNQMISIHPMGLSVGDLLAAAVNWWSTAFILKYHLSSRRWETVLQNKSAHFCIRSQQLACCEEVSGPPDAEHASHFQTFHPAVRAQGYSVTCHTVSCCCTHEKHLFTRKSVRKTANCALQVRDFL